MNPKYIVLLLALGPGPLMALSDDIDQPLNIEADTAEYNDKTGISKYSGAVKISQGSMILTGEVVTIEAPGQSLGKITSEGTPATFQQLSDDGDLINAEAEYMQYQSSEHKLLLLRKAKMKRGKNSFSSERIAYDIVKKIIDAGDPDKGNRVRMTITPEKKQPQQ